MISSNTASYVFFNKKKEIAMLTVSETHERRGYFATISVRTIRKSATEGYFIKDLGKMNLRSLADNKESLNILNLELDYLYRGNYYATRMAAVATELAKKQGYKYLITYAPHDPIISFKNINNKISDHETLGDRTELFFKSCGFKDIGTYSDKHTRGDGLRVYARAVNQPIPLNYNGSRKAINIERESKFISSHIQKRMEANGEMVRDVAK